ncbi:Cd209e [Phodopus roborovskii]|uniref:Cd209e protein n=1 Tax=Phodopus roborovskii TaxID=109678 RepID=A0AAV0A4Z0_PHORO|nr:Cd209e [Phodopus roborovskii]
MTVSDSKVRVQQMGSLGHIPLVLQLLLLVLFAGLLAAIVIQVFKIPSSEEMQWEETKQEKFHQDLSQLKSELDSLCRHCPWDWTFFNGNCYFFSGTGTAPSLPARRWGPSWLSSKVMRSSFVEYWNRGQPNNIGGQDCVEFRNEGWNDAKCDDMKLWICKKSATTCFSK